MLDQTGEISGLPGNPDRAQLPSIEEFRTLTPEELAGHFQEARNEFGGAFVGFAKAFATKELRDSLIRSGTTTGTFFDRELSETEPEEAYHIFQAIEKYARLIESGEVTEIDLQRVIERDRENAPTVPDMPITEYTQHPALHDPNASGHALRKLVTSVRQHIGI